MLSPVMNVYIAEGPHPPEGRERERERDGTGEMRTTTTTDHHRQTFWMLIQLFLLEPFFDSAGNVYWKAVLLLRD